MSLLSAVVPVDAVLQRPHSLLEGPRFGAAGEAVYSDVIAGGVWACSREGVVRELLPRRRGIGGIVAHADGGWVVSGRSVVHVGADGQQREILAGDAVCGYNDLGATPEGELLAGVLRYRPLAGEDPLPGQLLLVDRSGAAEVLTEAVIWPNGIGLSPGGETIYLSDYAQRVVLAIDRRGGAVAEFCRSPAGSVDGLAIDCEGGVWVALGEGGALARFRADGELDELITMPAQFVSSLCFGGADMCDVLITTADNEREPELGGMLLRARSEVAGLALAPVAV